MIASVFLRVSAAAVTLALLLAHSSFAQEVSGLDRIAKTVSLLQIHLGSLTGIVDSDIKTQEQIWLRVAQRFARHPKVATIFTEAAIRAKNSGTYNQQQVFLDVLLNIACQTFADSCEFKRQINALLSKNEEQDDRLDKQQQQIDSIKRELHQRQDTYFRGPSIGEPAPTPTALRVPNSSRVWKLGVDRITYTEDLLCRSAYCIERCVDVPVGTTGQSLYHGDLFQNCRGQIVLVRHQKKAW